MAIRRQSIQFPQQSVTFLAFESHIKQGNQLGCGPPSRECNNGSQEKGQSGSIEIGVSFFQPSQIVMVKRVGDDNQEFPFGSLI